MKEIIRVKKDFLMIGVISAIVSLLLKTLYRSYIYAHQIQGDILADSGTSFFTVVAIIFVVLYFVKELNVKKGMGICIGITAGALFYELEQIYSEMIFDSKDTILVLLAGLVSVGMLRYLINREQTKTRG